MEDKNWMLFQRTHVVKLQAACRAAGMRWKSGAPGYHKEGLIEKLGLDQTYERAVAAFLERQERAQGVGPISAGEFFSLDDEPTNASEAREVVVSTQPQAQKESMPDIQAPQVDLTRVWEAIQNAQRTADARVTHAAALDYATREAQKATAALKGQFDAIQIELANLRKQAPVVFTLKDKVSTLPINGAHYLFPTMVQALEAQALKERNILLIGPASSGKSQAARMFAELKGLQLYSQPQTMDSFGVLGIETPSKIIRTPFVEGWQSGGVILIDEISMNGADAIGALNDALAGGFCPIPGFGYVPRHPDCWIIAGDNSDTGASTTYSARQVLDGATLDRFIRLEWDIDPRIEEAQAGEHKSYLRAIRALRAYIKQRDIEHVGGTVRALIQGCAMLDRTDIPRSTILELTCKKGVLAASWSQVIALPDVAAFLRGQ